MQTVSDRRAFVRGVLAGVPVIAMTSFPATLSGAGHTASGMTPDLDSRLRDLARLHNQMRRNVPTAADVRALAAHLRSLAAYQIQASRDVALTQQFQDALGRHGRELLTTHAPDPARMRLELVSFGFDGPLVPDMTAGVAARAAALERLSRSGLAPMYADASMSLDGIEMIYLTAGASSCDTLAEMSQTMDAVAAVMCSLALVAPLAAPECFAAMSVAAALKLIMFLRGC
jgi:hypothetical protein